MIRYLCVIGFIAELVQGTITDWSTIYFRDELDASPLLSTMGYALFSVFGSLGMILSDYYVKIYFRQQVITWCCVMGVAGVALLTLSGWIDEWVDVNHFSIIVAILGSALAGGSVSAIIPIVFSAAGDIPLLKPSESIAEVTGIAYIAFLVGPPFFGFISDFLGSLKYVFLIISILVAVMGVYPGDMPHNSYSLAHLAKEKRDEYQSTDFLWHQSRDESVSSQDTPQNYERVNSLKIEAINQHLVQNRYPVF